MNAAESSKDCQGRRWGGGVNQGGESAQCTPLIYMYMHENIQRPHMKRKQKFWHDVVFVLNTSSALVINVRSMPAMAVT